MLLYTKKAGRVKMSAPLIMIPIPKNKKELKRILIIAGLIAIAAAVAIGLLASNQYKSVMGTSEIVSADGLSAEEIEASGEAYYFENVRLIERFKSIRNDDTPGCDYYLISFNSGEGDTLAMLILTDESKLFYKAFKLTTDDDNSVCFCAEAIKKNSLADDIVADYVSARDSYASENEEYSTSDLMLRYMFENPDELEAYKESEKENYKVGVIIEGVFALVGVIMISVAIAIKKEPENEA